MLLKICVLELIIIYENQVVCDIVKKKKKKKTVEQKFLNRY